MRPTRTGLAEGDRLVPSRSACRSQDGEGQATRRVVPPARPLRFRIGRPPGRFRLHGRFAPAARGQHGSAARCRGSRVRTAGPPTAREPGRRAVHERSLVRTEDGEGCRAGSHGFPFRPTAPLGGPASGAAGPPFRRCSFPRGWSSGSNGDQRVGRCDCRRSNGAHALLRRSADPPGESSSGAIHGRRVRRILCRANATRASFADERRSNESNTRGRGARDAEPARLSGRRANRRGGSSCRRGRRLAPSVEGPEKSRGTSGIPQRPAGTCPVNAKIGAHRSSSPSCPWVTTDVRLGRDRVVARSGERDERRHQGGSRPTGSAACRTGECVRGRGVRGRWNPWCTGRACFRPSSAEASALPDGRARAMRPFRGRSTSLVPGVHGASVDSCVHGRLRPTAPASPRMSAGHAREAELAEVPDRYAACGREVDRAAGETVQRVGAASGSGVRCGRCRRWRNRVLDAAGRDAPDEGKVGRAAPETPQPVGAVRGALGKSDATGIGLGTPEASMRRCGRGPANARSGVTLVRSCNRRLRRTPLGGIRGRREGGGFGSEAQGWSMRRVGANDPNARSDVALVISRSRSIRGTPLGEIRARRDGDFGYVAPGSSRRRLGANGAKASSAVAQVRPWPRPDRRVPRLGDPRPPLPHGREVPATSARRQDARRSASAGSVTRARCP